MSFEARVVLSVLAHEPNSGDIATGVRVTSGEHAMALAEGTGANQANLAFTHTATIAAGGSLTVMTAGSTSLDDRGTLSFTAIKAIYIRNTGTVALRFAGAGPASGNYSIPAGGAWAATNPTDAGFAITGSSAMAVHNDAASSGACEIVLIGEGTIA